MKIGVNTYGLSALRGPNPQEIFGRLRHCGVDSVELCLLFREEPKEQAKQFADSVGGLFLPEEGEDLLRQLRDVGLKSYGAHILGADFTLENVANTAQTLIDYARRNQLQYYVLSLALSKIEEVSPYVEALNIMAKALKEAGLEFLYHNHEHELVNDRGSNVLDFLMENVPDMALQIDVGWICFAGQDPIWWMERYCQRIRIIHFKDIVADACEENRENCFAAIGEGTIPMEQIIAAGRNCRLYEQGHVIDQDRSKTDMLWDIGAAVQNLRAGKCVSRPGAISGNPLQLSVWSMLCMLTKENQSFVNLMHACSRVGVPCVDLMRGEVEFYGIETIQHVLSSAGMKTGCYITHYPMTKFDASFREKVRQDLDWASQLHAQRMMIVPTHIHCSQDAAERARAADEIVKFFALAVEEGKAYGLQICVEDTPSCYVPLSTAEECRYLLDRVPELGLVFDTANMIPGGDDPEHFYEALKDRICHVHLKDVQFAESGMGEPCSNGKDIVCVPSGQGIVPVRKLMERMIADGYHGSAMLEYVQPQSPGYGGHYDQLQIFIQALFG